MKINKIVAACGCIFAVGLVITGVGVLCGGRVYGVGLSTDGLHVNYEGGGKDGGEVRYEKIEEDLEAFENMDLSPNFADLEIIESDHYGIEANVFKESPITYQVENGTLTLTEKGGNFKDGDFNFVFVGSMGFHVNSETPYIRIYVPKGTTFNQVTLKEESGDIQLNSLTADSLTVDNSFGSVQGKLISADVAEFDLDSGDLKLEQLEAESCDIHASFGDINIDTVKVKEDITCNTDSGDVELKNITANTLHAKLSFGGFTSDYMTVDKLDARLSSGDCSIKAFGGNTIIIDADFGDTSIGLTDAIDTYSCDLDADFGSVTVDHEDKGNDFETVGLDENRSITINGDSGDIKIYQK